MYLSLLALGSEYSLYSDSAHFIVTPHFNISYIRAGACVNLCSSVFSAPKEIFSWRFRDDILGLIVIVLKKILSKLDEIINNLEPISGEFGDRLQKKNIFFRSLTIHPYLFVT